MIGSLTTCQGGADNHDGHELCYTAERSGQFRDMSRSGGDVMDRRGYASSLTVMNG